MLDILNDPVISFVIENETPQISGNTTLYVEANKEVELKFNVSDARKNQH